jgi:hypothetical protein
MKRLLLIPIWTLTTAALASAQSSFFYPHVVNGTLGAVSWKTTIFLTNPASSGSATGAITFTQDNSNQISAGSSWKITLTDDTGFTTTSSVFTFSLPPGASRKFVSTAPGGFVSGFANVTTNPGTVNGTAIFSEFDINGSLIGEAGVPSVNNVPRQSIFVDTLNGYSVGVAYANPGTSLANITLTLLNDLGASVTTPVTQTLGQGNHTQAFTSQLFPSVKQPMVGTMLIASSTPLIAIALRFDPSLSKFTTLPAVTVASFINNGVQWLQRREAMFSVSIATLMKSFGFDIG